LPARMPGIGGPAAKTAVKLPFEEVRSTCHLR
jgi:hypothetical protein